MRLYRYRIIKDKNYLDLKVERKQIGFFPRFWDTCEFFSTMMEAESYIKLRLKLDNQEDKTILKIFEPVME